MLREWKTLRDLQQLVSVRMAVIDAVGLEAFLDGTDGYVEVGGFVRGNAEALARLCVPLLSRGYLRKRKRGPGGGYQPRFFVLDRAAGEPRYYKDERAARAAKDDDVALAPQKSCSPPRHAAGGGSGSIRLAQLCGVFHEPSKKNGCGLKLIDDEREWHLVAPSRAEAVGWARSLTVARGRALVSTHTCACYCPSLPKKAQCARGRAQERAAAVAGAGQEGSGSAQDQSLLRQRVAALREENARLQRQARALRELRARDASILSL